MIITRKLSNGITVVLEEMNYLRSVSLGVWVKAGSAYENRTNNGISHMIEHMLFKGTKNRTAKKLAEETARIGGSMNAYTSKECTTYYITTLDEHIETAIELISDMLNNSLFDKGDISKEKGVIIEEIDMYEDSPEDMVHEMLQKNIWADHPLGYIISGEKDIVNSFTREDLLDFMKTHYIAENIVVSIAGHFDGIETMEWLEKYFSQIHSSNQKLVTTKPVYHRCFYKGSKDIEQIHMNIAFDSIDYFSEEKYTLAIVNGLLGASENSKLFQIIREELGLTYSIYSYGCSYEKAGLFHIDGVLNPNKLTTVLSEIIKVIEGLKRTGITLEELEQMKEQIKTELIIESESTRNRMDSNGKAILNKEPLITTDETIHNLNKVTKEEAHYFMNKYFCMEQASLSLVGNLDEGNLTQVEKLLYYG